MSDPIACIEDLRAVAERRIPRMFYDYVDSGSYTESTCRANEADLRQIRSRQRVGVDIGARNLTTVMAGRQVAMPVALAPTGLAGMMRGNGEILAARAAQRAVDAGADVIVVSNHGERQLDGAVSSVQALPAIVDAVGERVEVWLDSGVRTGQDVLKAVALGARGTMIGRAFLYELAAAGEAGVHKSLEIIAAELDTTMALCGCTDIAAVGPEILATRGA